MARPCAAPRRRTYQAKDAAAAEALAARISGLATAEGASTVAAVRFPARLANCTWCRLARGAGHSARAVVSASSVTVELTTAAVGGVTENDFIVAAKVDALPLTDLIVTAKKRTYYF